MSMFKSTLVSQLQSIPSIRMRGRREGEKREGGTEGGRKGKEARGNGGREE